MIDAGLKHSRAHRVNYMLITLQVSPVRIWITRPSETVRPIRPWPDQTFPHSIQNKSYIV